MTTVLNGWHRPTDAVAALLIVGGWGVLAALATQLIDAAVARSRLRTGGTPAGSYRRFMDERSHRRQERAWSEDRGDSAYLPPAHERQARELERAASAARDAERRNRPRAQRGAWDPRPYGYRGALMTVPARPRLGTAVTLTVVTGALLAVAIWWPYPALAGTFGGRVTLTAGYLGIAAAAALGWSMVARRLRSATR